MKLYRFDEYPNLSQHSLVVAKRIASEHGWKPDEYRTPEFVKALRCAVADYHRKLSNIPGGIERSLMACGLFALNDLADQLRDLYGEAD